MSLTNLEELSLRGNLFYGKIPDAIGSLTKLLSLELESNKFRKSIPPSITNLVNLETLHLGSNQLTGTIPAAIGRMTNLQRLNLGENDLIGNIPEEIGLLTNLICLNLQSNFLTGTIPDSIGLLTKLRTLILDTNCLYGSLPEEMAELTLLTEVLLHDNQFTGMIPEELKEMEWKSVDISENHFSAASEDDIPEEWKTYNAFQPWSNLAPQEILKLLDLDLDEHYMKVLSALVHHEEPPTTLEEWMQYPVPIGFPDNPVWPSISRALTDLPDKVQSSLDDYEALCQRIAQLRTELKELEAKEAELAPLARQLVVLKQHAPDVVHMAQQLSSMETERSAEATEDYLYHTFTNEQGQSAGSGEMAMSSWEAILECAGVRESGFSLATLMEEVLSGEEIDKLSYTERWDLRYLRHMTELQSVPYIHPYHERRALNEKLNLNPQNPPYQSEHSCVVCECGTPLQLTNLLKEMKSPLAKLRWTDYFINGPRMLMMNSQDLQLVFGLSSKQVFPIKKAIGTLKKKHLQQFFTAEHE